MNEQSASGSKLAAGYYAGSSKAYLKRVISPPCRLPTGWDIVQPVHSLSTEPSHKSACAHSALALKGVSGACLLVAAITMTCELF